VYKAPFTLSTGEGFMTFGIAVRVEPLGCVECTIAIGAMKHGGQEKRRDIVVSTRNGAL
jgi:hypothetical protein